MTFVLGIFDLFAYAIPGALQLLLLLYLGQRLHWLDVRAVLAVPSGPLFVGLALASYLLGHLEYPLGSLVDRLSRPRPVLRWDEARASFLARNPHARDRAFVNADVYLLQAAVELHAREVAAEISRLRAVGLMLRNCGVPLALGALTALVELALARQRVHAGSVAALLTLASVMAVQRGIRLRSWALGKTFELAFWVPDIDRNVGCLAAPISAAGVAEPTPDELSVLDQVLSQQESQESQ